jgi:hypothetical protein
MRSRSTLRVLLLAVLAILPGCGTDLGVDPLLPVPAGIRATWAGDAFQGPAVAYRDGATLELVAHTEDAPQLNRGLRVRITDFAGPGSYALGAGAAQVMYVVGGDPISARYGTTAAGAGTLVVTEVEDGTLSGTVAFNADALPSASLPAGSRAHFQGVFQAPVQTPGW